MNEFGHADRLCTWARVQVVVNFHCEKCDAVFSATGTPYAGARKAVGTGWRISSEDEPRCPNCVKE